MSYIDVKGSFFYAFCPNEEVKKIYVIKKFGEYKRNILMRTSVNDCFTVSVIQSIAGQQKLKFLEFRVDSAYARPRHSNFSLSWHLIGISEELALKPSQKRRCHRKLAAAGRRTWQLLENEKQMFFFTQQKLPPPTTLRALDREFVLDYTKRI
jgi:hypothetical protein